MYIVASVRKSGSRTYTYYNLVEGVRTPKGPRHRVILSLGKLDSIPADRIKLLGRLVDGRLSGQIRLLPAEAEEPVLQQEAERIAQLVVAKHAADPADEPPIAVRPETVSASEAVLLGPVYVGNQIWRRLGLDEILTECGFSHRQRTLAMIEVVSRLVNLRQ